MRAEVIGNSVMRDARLHEYGIARRRTLARCCQTRDAAARRSSMITLCAAYFLAG